MTCLPHGPRLGGAVSLSRHKKGVDTGDKRSYDRQDFAQLRLARFWGRWGLHVKQSVNGWSRIVWSWIALAAVLTAALSLAACGRKGPLDPPPSAALTQPAPAARPGLGEEHYGTPPGAPPPPAAAAPAPAAQQKTFFLDFLIGK